MAIRPRRCYSYTTEEQLDADVAAGVLSAEAAKALRDFRDWLGVRSEMTRRTKEEGNTT
jgi:hypothetical protein